MTATPPVTDVHVPAAPARRRPALRGVVRPAVPVWESAFRDPVVDGHIRLAGLSWSERQAARIGLVTLALLLGSLLFVDVWRRGTLLPLGDGSSLTFLPVGLLPVTLLTFLVAWTMLAWGALTSAWPVKLFVAAAFLLTNSSMSTPAAIEVGDRAALKYGDNVLQAGYYLTAGVILLALVLPLLPARWGSRTLPVLRLLVVAGLTAFFMSHLWIHVASVEEGFPGAVQMLVSGAIAEIDGLLLPLVYVSAVLVIDFAMDVSLGVARSARDVPAKAVRWLLVGLLAVKLWLVLLDELGEWATYAQDRPLAVLRTAVSVVALAVVVRLVTRRRVTAALDGAKERLLYGTSLALAFPVVLSILVVGSGVFALTQFKMDRIPWFVDAYPTDDVGTYLQPALAVLAILVGLWLLRRRRGPMDTEFGSGLLVIGAWALPSLLINMSTIEIGFSDELVDVVVTLGVAGVVVRRWNRLDTRLAVILAAVTVFTWLAMTKGDWINLVGSLAGLPAILVVVVGVVFSVAGDAGFTAEGGRVVPQGARVLLFVGYLVLSVTILHWVEATHAPSNADFMGDAGFFFVGIPWAAWLIGRRLLHLEEDPEPASHPSSVE